MKPRFKDAPDMARAASELFLARLFLACSRGDEVARLAALGDVQQEVPSPAWPREVERIAWLIPRVAARLPWRSDCLVQALAARRWLARLGHDTKLHLGARKQDGRMEAHAWLTCEGHIVTGGDIGSYAPFASSSTSD